MIKIKSLENNSLGKNIVEALTKYMNSAYTLEETMVPDFDNIIKKVLKESLEENLEEFYKLFTEFLENLSDFEKLIKLLKDFPICSGSSYVSRTENMWINCLSCNDWYQRHSDISENIYSKQNKKSKWKCSKEGKLSIRASVNTAEQKMSECRKYKETCSYLDITLTWLSKITKQIIYIVSAL